MAANTSTKKRKVTLTNVPDDVFTFLLKKQNQIKEQKKVSQFSLERTLYTVIKETKDFKDCKECK